MVPFDVVTGRDYIVSQSGSVTILCESLKRFSIKMYNKLGRSTYVPLGLLHQQSFTHLLRYGFTPPWLYRSKFPYLDQ